MKIHWPRYLVLWLTFGFGLFFFFHFRYNKAIQIGVVAGLSLAYFIWGMVHHHLEKNLYFKVVLEYLLIALLGAALVISLILKA